MQYLMISSIGKGFCAEVSIISHSHTMARYKNYCRLSRAPSARYTNDYVVLHPLWLHTNFRDCSSPSSLPLTIITSRLRHLQRLCSKSHLKLPSSLHDLIPGLNRHFGGIYEFSLGYLLQLRQKSGWLGETFRN